MNWLQRLFQGCDREPPSASAAPPPNLAQHDELIEELAESLLALRRINREPITARVRGQYPPRRVREIRIHPGSAAHHD